MQLQQLCKRLILKEQQLITHVPDLLLMHLHADVKMFLGNFTPPSESG